MVSILSTSQSTEYTVYILYTTIVMYQVYFRCCSVPYRRMFCTMSTSLVCSYRMMSIYVNYDTSSMLCLLVWKALNCSVNYYCWANSTRNNSFLYSYFDCKYNVSNTNSCRINYHECNIYICDSICTLVCAKTKNLVMEILFGSFITEVIW